MSDLCMRCRGQLSGVKRNISPETAEKIRNLRARGFSLQETANITKTSKNTVIRYSEGIEKGFARRSAGGFE